MDAWLATSHLYQLTNADLVAGLCWWFAALVLVEIPRVMRWIGKACDALETR